MSDLARSESYYKKQCLEKLGYIPPQTEIKKRMSPALAQAFFESCLPVIKPFLGLCPTLDGPGDDLWISPSDLLIGKVRLKPPLTSKHIKALTHQGILEIGEEVERKFNREHEIEKQRALAENEELLLYKAEKEKQEAMDQVRAEEKCKQEEIVAQLKLDFQETLNEELHKLEEQLQEEKLVAVEEGKKQVEKLMQEKLELAILETVQRLTEQFAETLMKHSKCLHEHFWYHIKQEKSKLKKLIMDEKSTCRDKLEQLRVEMQCENIANIMYVLAKERRKCSCEKQLLEQNFITRLQELEKELEDRAERLETTMSELERLGQAVRAREEAMYEIIKQFQKFIYFVLRAVPTQAEYLLNIEKIMIVHLTKTVQDTKPEFFQVEAKSATSYSGSSRSVKSDKCSDHTEGIVAKDYHECDNYVRYIPSDHTMSEEEDLPAFTYDEHLYVREDFRNMISQGLKISRSNEFWNFNVEDVTNIIEPETTDEIEVEQDQCCTDKKVIYSDKDKSYVSVRFSKGFEQVFFEEKVLQSHQYSTVAEPSDSITSEEKNGSNDSLDLITNRMPSKIEMAKDSLTVLKKKDPVLPSPLKADSLILSARRSVDSKVNNTKEILTRRRESKIELHVDSMILLKSNATLQSTQVTKGEGFVHKRHLVNVGVQVEPDPKSVRISHIEVIKEPDAQRTSVSFHARPKIIPEEDEGILPPCNEKLPLKWRSPEEIYGRASAAKVSGDRASTAHLECQDEFTAKRVNSFIRIFREQPSLRRLFTEVKNK